MTSNSSRAKTGHASLKAHKVLSKEIVNFSISPDTVVLRAYRVLLAKHLPDVLRSAYNRQTNLVRVHQVSDADRVQVRWTEVRLTPHPLVMLEQHDAALARLHFLLNACEPNQNAITDAQMICVSSSQRYSSIRSNGTKVFHA